MATIYRKGGDVVAECEACGAECTELFFAYSDRALRVCEDCLEEDFKEMFEEWKADHAVDLDYEERRQDEQNVIDTEEAYRDMREDD